MAEFIKQSWVFPVVQSVHLIGLTILVGSICLVDLRLLGVGRGVGRCQHIADFASAVAPWTKRGLLTVLITGPLMFGSDLTRYMNNPAFLLKMGLLAVALAGQFTLHRRAVRDAGTSTALTQKIAAVLSLIVWSSIVLAGRAIADFDIRIV